MGLSTVPALGLFGYAWNSQQPLPAGEGGGSCRDAGRPGRSAGDRRRPARRGGAGPGADGVDAAHPGLALPCGVRYLDRVQPAACRQHAQAVQARGQRLRRLPRDARQGEGARRGHHRHARLLARAAHDRLPQGRQARVLREGDVEHARGRAQHGGSPSARPAGFSRSAISAARTRATSTATRSCWARRSCSAGSSPSTASGIVRSRPISERPIATRFRRRS